MFGRSFKGIPKNDNAATVKHHVTGLGGTPNSA